MSRFRLCAAALLAIALGAAVSAQDKQRFEPKFEKDKAFFQEMKTDVTQNIKVQGQDLLQKQESTFWFKWQPLKQEGDKWQLKETLEGVRMKIDISGNPIEYDSSKKDVSGSAGNPGLMDFFRNLEGTEFTVTMNKDFKVEKVDGKEEFTKKLGSGSTQMNTLLSKIMSEETLKQMADMTFGMVPDQPKAVGESWEKKTSLNLGPIGSYDVTYKFTYKGKDDKNKELDKIEVLTTLVYTAPKEAIDGGSLLFKIKAGNLKSENPVPGEIKYNPKTGRIEDALIKIKLTGELTVTIGGTDTKVELNQEQTTTIKTSDKSFMAEKK